MSRKKLGPRRHLQERRRQAGFSQEALAEALGASVTAVRSWEQGWSTPMPRYRPALAGALGVSLAEIARLLDPGAVQLDGHRVPSWLTHYDSLVLAVGVLKEAQMVHIPALLQTKAYAAAIERYGPLALTDEQIIERVDVRLARAGVLDRDAPLELVVLIAEHALHEVVGGRDVMVEQLDHLLEAAQRPSIDLRVLPADGRALCALGGFQLLARPGDPEPFMVVTLDAGGARYHEAEAIKPFATTFSYLDSVALSPFDSINLVRKTREDHRR